MEEAWCVEIRKSKADMEGKTFQHDVKERHFQT
jgi:hypothetical protein